MASDGEEGLAKIPTFQPNIILLDIIMPKKDGFDVLQEMAANPVYKIIPVIVFSTLGDQADLDKAMKLGAKDYVNKSFLDFENLKLKVATYLPKT